MSDPGPPREGEARADLGEEWREDSLLDEADGGWEGRRGTPLNRDAREAAAAGAVGVAVVAGRCCCFLLFCSWEEGPEP